MKQDDQYPQHNHTFQLVEGHGSPPSNPQEQKKAVLWRQRMKLEFEVQALIVRTATLVQEWQLLHGQKAAQENEVPTIASQLLLAGWLESQQHPSVMQHPYMKDHQTEEASRIRQDMLRCSMDIATAQAQIIRLDVEQELALDFLRERVVIWKYVYTCSVCQKSQCLCEDDPEMGSSWDFARQANHYQPALLHRC